MGKSVLRKDKTCLNCNYVVENRFCPNCGQENSDTRKTFHHLFIHFIEDLTHYENAFWKTIKNLLFKPANLTKEYLSGKRLSYLAPVRLYIFISFITFLILALLPPATPNINNPSAKNNGAIVVKSDDAKAEISAKKLSESIMDSIEMSLPKDKLKKQNGNTLFNFGINSVKDLDSIQNARKPSEKFSSFEYWFFKKGLTVTENNTTEEIIEKGKESFLRNFSKVLFIYMPLFAFFLWLFHNKKRWYYFDHGIFTLHYFSFLLLIFLIIFLSKKALTFFDSAIVSFLSGVISFIGYTWMLYYFFPAHHRFYGETRVISFIKSILLFFINFFIIAIILTLFAIYTFINLH